MKQINEESFWIYETNNCDKNNTVYSIECWFINVHFVFFLILLILYLVLALLFIFTVYIFLEFGKLGSQTHKSQTLWSASTLVCFTPCLLVCYLFGWYSWSMVLSFLIFVDYFYVLLSLLGFLILWYQLWLL